jgi:hypothetical protein
VDIVRNYRPCGVRIALRGYALLVAVMLAGVVVADASERGHFPTGDALVFGILVMSILVYFERVGSRVGVIETPDAIIDRGGASATARTIAKCEVLRFEPVNGALGLVRVAAVMKDDSRNVLRGVHQRRPFGKRGRPVEWDGGRTRDIIGELNARLAAHPDPDREGHGPDM